MKKVIVGIGVPGSGKTTVLKNFAGRYAYAYICPDDIRAEMTGDPKDQSKNREVWDEAYRRMAKGLDGGQTIVFDATLADERTRQQFLALARQYGAEKVQGVYVVVPLETAKERNAVRTRVVLEHVLEKMHGNLENNSPHVGEGFDAIFTLDEYQTLVAAEKQGNESVKYKGFRPR